MFQGYLDGNEVALLTGANSQCEITTCHCDYLLLSEY